MNAHAKVCVGGQLGRTGGEPQPPRCSSYLSHPASTHANAGHVQKQAAYTLLRYTHLHRNALKETPDQRSETNSTHSRVKLPHLTYKTTTEVLDAQ